VKTVDPMSLEKDKSDPGNFEALKSFMKEVHSIIIELYYETPKNESCKIQYVLLISPQK
jgi:hypothetical protein